MIKAVIIDDEQKARETLKELLNIYCKEVDICATGASVKEAAELIKIHKPHLVFLDVEMPFENGFSLFSYFPEINFDVVFTTAFDHYALRAIKCCALDYLLKPIDADDLIEAVQKLQYKKTREDRNKSYQTLISNLKDKVQRVILPSQEGIVIADVNSIVSVIADNNYVHINMVNKPSLLIAKTLKYMEGLLPDDIFMRVHNSTIINLYHMVKYVRGEGGFAVMNDNSTFEISRRKKSEFIERMNSL